MEHPKTCMTCFIAIFDSLPQSETEPTISLRYACISNAEDLPDCTVDRILPANADTGLALVQKSPQVTGLLSLGPTTPEPTRHDKRSQHHGKFKHHHKSSPSQQPEKALKQQRTPSTAEVKWEKQCWSFLTLNSSECAWDPLLGTWYCCTPKMLFYVTLLWCF